MPTGFTAGIEDGTLTEFREFALQCARAFGAAIMLRDSDPDTVPTPENVREKSSFHDDQIEQSTSRLELLRAMTADEVAAAYEDEFQSAEAAFREREAEAATKRLRYNAMLADVRAWVPPTSDHEGLRVFMLEQIEKSMEWVGTPTPPEREEPLQWHLDNIEREERSVARSKEQAAKQRKRNETRSQWVTDLLNSLPAEQA